MDYIEGKLCIDYSQSIGPYHQINHDIHINENFSFSFKSAGGGFRVESGVGGLSGI